MDPTPKDLLSDDLPDDEPPALPDEVGELAIDAYETDDEVVIKAPMAGVKPDNLELAITDDTITIKGKRHAEHEEKKGNYLLQECYWGSFERAYKLPVAVDAEKAKAQLKDGLLTIFLPKASRSKTKVIEVKAE